MRRTATAILTAFAAGAILFNAGWFKTGASVLGQTNTGGATDRIRACVTSTGSVRFLTPPAATCRTGERLVEWNVQGPPGAPGPAGEAGQKGAKGDKGDKGEPGADGLRTHPSFFDVFPEIGRVGFLDVPPGTSSADGAAAEGVTAVVDPVVERKVHGFTTGQGRSDADADNDGFTDRVAGGDVDADGFGPVGIDLAVDGSRPSLAEAAARRHVFRQVTLFVEADMDGDGVVHVADEAGNADEGLVLQLEDARIVRHGYQSGTDFLAGRRHDAAMSSIGNIRARTATVDGRGPTVILEHIELDYDRITWLSSNAGVMTTLGRWDVREGHSN